MKRIITLITGLLLISITLSAQDKNKKRNVMNMYGGISVGGGDAGYDADTPREKISDIPIIDNTIWFVDADGDTLKLGISNEGGTDISDLFVKQLQDTVSFTADTKTLALTDAGKIVYFSNADFQAITIPANTTVGFPIGTVITFINGGSGIAKIIPAANVVIKSVSDSVTMNTPNQTYQIIKRATNKWYLIGDFKD